MIKTIKAVSDKIAEKISELDRLGKTKENLIKKEYKLKEALYTSIFFAPLKNDNNLGEFHFDSKAIILSDSLLDEDDFFIKNIFLHELSHALDFALTRIEGSPHGQSFRACCSIMGVSPDFQGATIPSFEKRRKEERRIEKLLSLSSSNFISERESALKKAQELIIKNNIQIRKAEKTYKKIYYVELYKGKKVPVWIKEICHFISSATGTFFVITRADNDCEVFLPTLYGSFKEVELSLYLYDYLINSFSSEINEKQKGCKETIHKPSFIVFAVREMAKKLNKENSASVKTALTVIKNENQKNAMEVVFKNTRLKKAKNSISIKNKRSMVLGLDFGSKLVLPRQIAQRKIN